MAKVLFLVTVDTSPNFDGEVGTRRMMRDRFAVWSEMYRLVGLVSNISCGNDYPVLNFFEHSFGLLGRHMRLIEDLGQTEILRQPKRALGQLIEHGHHDMVITSTKIGHAIRLACQEVPELGHSLLSIILIEEGRLQIISTEDRFMKPPKLMPEVQFRAILEEASERAASRA